MNNLGYKYLFSFLLLISGLFSGCLKDEETGVIATKIKSPQRTYHVTARLDKKEANTDSKATGLLVGQYSEKTKVFSYTITYDIIEPLSIKLGRGSRGSVGNTVFIFDKNSGSKYVSPLKGQKALTALQERDLIKGLWFLSIETATYKPSEIRGQLTLKQGL